MARSVRFFVLISFILILFLSVAVAQGQQQNGTTITTPSVTVAVPPAPTLSSLFNNVTSLPRGTVRNDPGTIIAAVIFGIIGLAYCFWGYHLFRPTLFITGSIVVSSIAFSVLVKYQLITDRLMLILASIGFGLLGGALFVCCMSVGIAMIGAVGGAVLGHIIISAAGITLPIARIAIIVGLAVLGCILVCMLERPMIIASTSLAGAYILIFCIDLVVNAGIAFDAINHASPVQQSYLEYGGVGGAALLGMLYQWFRHKRETFRPQKELPRYAPVNEQKFQPPPAYAPGAPAYTPSPVVIISPNTNANNTLNRQG